MIKGVIFDLFNTLAKSQCPEEKLKKRLNLNLDFLNLQKLVCAQKYENWADYVGNILKGVNRPLTAENREIVAQVFEEDSARFEFFKEAMPILKTLKAKGLRLGLISNIANPKLDFIRGTDKEQLFDSIVYSYELGAVKPEPLLFTECLSELGLEPQTVLMVGDSLPADIYPAERLGLKTVLIDREYQHPEIVNRISSLKKIINFV